MNANDLFMEQTEDSFDENAEISVTCAICMCDLEPTDYLYNLKCHHVFHVDCLEKWYSRRNRCPICRQPIDFIVTTQDHYTFDRAAFEASLKEQAKEMETKEFSATAGGGAVEVTVSGSKKILKVKLDEEVVDPDDVEMLEDLLVAAVNEALEKVDAETTSAMSKFTGGMGGGMPGLF